MLFILSLSFTCFQLLNCSFLHPQVLHSSDSPPHPTQGVGERLPGAELPAGFKPGQRDTPVCPHLPLPGAHGVREGNLLYTDTTGAHIPSATLLTVVMQPERIQACGRWQRRGDTDTDTQSAALLNGFIDHERETAQGSQGIRWGPPGMTISSWRWRGTR